MVKSNVKYSSVYVCMCVVQDSVLGEYVPSSSMVKSNVKYSSVYVCMCVVQDSVLGEYVPSSSMVKSNVKYSSVVLDALKSDSRQPDMTMTTVTSTSAVTADTDGPCTRAKRRACESTLHCIACCR